VTGDNEDRKTVEKLKKLLQHAKNRKSCELDNLWMELWQFGRNELKMHKLELFSNITDTNQMTQEWEIGMVINIHKEERKASVKITRELHCCLQTTSYLQT
jgi:hypothetical protein